MPDSARIQGDLRADAAHRLASMRTCDVLIIGGGVNGVGVLRDLALNGVSAVLIDHADFCSGASSASSRMAHGGLRYLEGREFRLVAESARERNRLLALAPHLVKPLEIVVPLDGIFTGLGRAVGRFLRLTRTSGPISLVALEAALVLYESLGRVGRSLPRHKTTLRRAGFPAGLSPRTKAVISYSDGQILQPEGLILEMLCEAMQVNPDCAALNHVRWRWQDGGAVISDTQSAMTWRIAPRIVVNAAGAAIDAVNAALGVPTQYIRGVRGAHLVIGHDGLVARMGGRAFYFDDGTGRMIIALPVAGNILIGTTEVETDDPEDRRITDPEIGYLLGAINRLFGDLEVTRADIVAMTAGIRPLRRGDDGASATAAARDHALEQDRLPTGVPVLSMVGGKWTTFRAFSEDAADRCLELLTRPRRQTTVARALPGAQPVGPDAADTGGDLPARYGSLAGEVAQFCRAWEADRPLRGNPAYSTGEIAWLALRRAACTVEDIVMRRTQLYYGRGLSRETAEDVAEELARCGRADAHALAREIDRLFHDPRIAGMRRQDGAVA